MSAPRLTAVPWAECISEIGNNIPAPDSLARLCDRHVLPIACLAFGRFPCFSMCAR